MRIIATGDWHGDWSTHGVDRFAEIERAVEQTVKEAVDWKSDLYVFLGDLCDPDSGSKVFRCVRMILDVARDISSHGIRFVAIAGNHDVIEDGSGETTLTPLRSIVGVNVALFEEPKCFFNVLALPFTASSHGYLPAEVAGGINSETIVISHLSVPGIQPGEETTEMPRGREVLYPFKETTRARLRLQGHYHRRQSFDPGDGGSPIHLPGSLARLTFNEEQHAPGFLKLEI